MSAKIDGRANYRSANDHKCKVFL